MKTGAHRFAVGEAFGTLTILALEPAGRAFVRCSCGVERSMLRASLTPSTRSCGCLRSTLLAVAKVKHGHTTQGGYRSPEYQSWGAMLQRCTNSRTKSYRQYGAIGISVCERWRSFANFLADMGPRPSATTLDRIDGSKGYEPNNCRWATSSEQANNRRANKRVTVHGDTKTIAQWALVARISSSAMKYRIQRWGVLSPRLLQPATPPPLRRARNTFLDALDAVSR